MEADWTDGVWATEEAPRRMFLPVTQRERLMDGMARTVASRGYAATSVADVLKVARISRRTFYEQFADKEDCFLAAYDEIATLCTDRVVAAYGAARTWEAGLAAALDALMHVLAAEPEYARLGVVEILAAGPRGLARRDETVKRFARFIRNAHERLAAPTPPELLVEAIVGGIYELVHARIVRGATAQLPALADDLKHYALIMLGLARNPA
jgi:AcrR family transcriptional regulator